MKISLTDPCLTVKYHSAERVNKNPQFISLHHCFKVFICFQHQLSYCTESWCVKMPAPEIQEIPMLLRTCSQLLDKDRNVESKRVGPKTWNASMSIPMYPIGEIPLVTNTSPPLDERETPLKQTSGPVYKRQISLVWPLLGLDNRTSSISIEEYPSFSEAVKKTWLGDNLACKNEHLLRSGQLGMCHDPYCTTCPAYYTLTPAQSLARLESKFHKILTRDAESWMKRSLSLLGSCIPGIMNPHAKVVQQWNKFFLISRLVSIFVDPLFFFLLSLQKENKCIVLDWPMAATIGTMRSITDLVYLLHMLLQFRLAYVNPESKVVGAAELVDRPKKIARHYLYGYFSIDVLVILPLPQILLLFIYFVSPVHLGSYSVKQGKKIIRAIVLLQYIPRFYRFLPLLAGRSASGSIFETALGNFVLNLFICALAGHVIGSCWYIFGLQRVNSCLRGACASSGFKGCEVFMDCERRKNIEVFKSFPLWKLWLNETVSTSCFDKEASFPYGIYAPAVELTTIPSMITRYIYSFFWGFQQISTLGGNLSPSYYVLEVLFTICIVGLGLFLFALLIGNMQNFLQALGRRKLEMQLRRHDVELWMGHRLLPEKLRRQVRKSERFHWAATGGVNEELLLESLPEDLQRGIRRHLFSFIKNVRMFALMEDSILDAFCGRLRQKFYINESKILDHGDVVDQMLFIVRGKLMSVDADGDQTPLSEGNICGEELLSWCLDHSSENKVDGRKIRIAGKQFLSNRTVTCLTNVEAYSLRAAEFEEVGALFPRFLRRVQDAIRYESPYFRGFAATTIQAAWRHRQKRLKRARTQLWARRQP